MVFDLVINNADRKGSHVIRGPLGNFWLIDHGVSFHVQDKLRTVIWDFAGNPISEKLCVQMSHFRNRLISREKTETELFSILKNYLSSAEVNAVAERVQHLIQSGVYPSPDPERRHYPWPQL